jgi:hypothetical protein
MSTPQNREDEFTDRLASVLESLLTPHRVGRKRSLLYDLSFDHKGNVTMGVDPDTGTPVRGQGRGFEQDILIFDDSTDSHTSVIPRVVLEIKVGSVTTHDVIVYSEKADRIRRVYPYVRYGFILGGMANIPGRVLRLGQRFDFVAIISEQLAESEVAEFGELLREEAAASIKMTELLFARSKPKLVRRALIVK